MKNSRLFSVTYAYIYQLCFIFYHSVVPDLIPSVGLTFMVKEFFFFSFTLLFFDALVGCSSPLHPSAGSCVFFGPSFAF
uniref:Uncharacterized protein n=1 Tax=Rhizophora mucronata TaxID=61149 RepID=A0A2P2MHR6_RHIMU